MDITKLTATEKKELMEQLAKEEREKEELRKKKVESYKDLVDETVMRNFKKIKQLSAVILNTKKDVFDDFSAVIESKEELYDVKDTQRSHTFTTKDGNFSIIVGHRQIDNYDDTFHAGISKVEKYISRTTAGEREELKELINLLLKKDKNGNLKASRVLELERITSKINDEELNEGVRIIKEAYQPTKSSTFIEAYYKDEQGKRISVPLSVTSVSNIEIEDDLYEK